MTDSIKADVLYFKTLQYEEIFRLFNDFENNDIFIRTYFERACR